MLMWRRFLVSTAFLALITGGICFSETRSPSKSRSLSSSRTASYSPTPSISPTVPVCKRCGPGTSGPCQSVFGVCWPLNPDWTCPVGSMACICPSCVGVYGPCHYPDGSCSQYAAGTLLCPAGSFECYNSNPEAPTPTATRSLTATASRTPTISQSPSPTLSETSSTSLTVSFTSTPTVTPSISPSNVRACSRCGTGTSGPCQSLDGKCWKLRPDGSCPVSSWQCVCPSCTEGTSGVCRSSDGTCTGYFPGTNLCPFGTFECYADTQSLPDGFSFTSSTSITASNTAEVTPSPTRSVTATVAALAGAQTPITQQTAAVNKAGLIAIIVCSVAGTIFLVVTAYKYHSRKKMEQLSSSPTRPPPPPAPRKHRKSKTSGDVLIDVVPNSEYKGPKSPRKAQIVPAPAAAAIATQKSVSPAVNRRNSGVERQAEPPRRSEGEVAVIPSPHPKTSPKQQLSINSRRPSDSGVSVVQPKSQSPPRHHASHSPRRRDTDRSTATSLAFVAGRSDESLTPRSQPQSQHSPRSVNSKHSPSPPRRPPLAARISRDDVSTSPDESMTSSSTVRKLSFDDRSPRSMHQLQMILGNSDELQQRLDHAAKLAGLAFLPKPAGVGYPSPRHQRTSLTRDAPLHDLPVQYPHRASFGKSDLKQHQNVARRLSRIVDGDSPSTDDSSPSGPDTDEYSTDDNGMVRLDRQVASTLQLVNRMIGDMDSKK